MSDAHEQPARLINHVGLTVTDLETSAAFYRDMVGFELVRRGTRPAGGDWFDTLTGGTNALIDVIVMAAPGFALQLVQYFQGGEGQSVAGHNRVGNVHLCINVDDLERKHAEVVRTGKWHPTPIVELPIPNLRSFYVRDPDGVPVEFIEGTYKAETTGLPRESQHSGG
jgi:catechol 2,3-dioxygenase-like lactoylglutathione lyase family enzyme